MEITTCDPPIIFNEKKNIFKGLNSIIWISNRRKGGVRKIWTRRQGRYGERHRKREEVDKARFTQRGDTETNDKAQTLRE